MAVALTQVITEDRASGGQVIDGSLKFVSGNLNHLERTPGSAGNQKTWTWSSWIKKPPLTSPKLFAASAASDSNFFIFDISSDSFRVYSASGGSYDVFVTTQSKFRDPSAWYHVVLYFDAANTTIRIYVNNVEQPLTTTTAIQNQNYDVNSAIAHRIGRDVRASDNTSYLDAYLSQVYLVDGQALDPSYFGFTDPLTNTWRPKKYTGTYGTNGFYLPLDGNSSIGEDKSGNGNNFTPVGFGNLNTIEKATGALPILNTVNGGNVAVPGVFGSKVSKTLTTTASTNTSNGFVFANEGTKPTLSFVRGATYTFDYSASTGHPLRFATAADAAGSTQYTDGTDTSVANTVKITVPHNAPDTLYYYCTNHGGMGNSISVTTDEKVADPYAWKNVLALPLVGSAADESNKLNVGSTTKTATVGGSVAASRAENNFYGTSYKFVGSDSIHYGTNADFEFDGDFTIECWVYATATGAQSLFVQQTVGGYFALNIDCNTGFDIYLNNGGAGYTVSKPFTNRWNHVAMVRSGSTVTIYLNGVAGTTITNSNTLGSTSNNFSVGGLGTQAGGSYTGYMSDFRIYKGVAKYTSNFIPASTDPDILPDTPSGVSGGSALTKITDGAVSFDNSGDSLTTPDHADFDLGTNSFTIEAFIYLQTIGQFNNIFAVGTDASNGYRIDVTTGNDLRFLSHIGGTWTDQGLLTDDPLAANRWYHVAVTRNGNDFDIWIDGQRGCSTVTSSSSITNPDTQLEIGRLTSNGLDRNYHGFISNLRFVNGSAVYTSPFTPPSAPLTNVTNTKLLCCQSTSSAGTAAVAPTIANNPNDGSIWSEVGTRSGTIIDWTSGFDGSRSTQTSNSSNTAAVITFDPVIPCSTATIWGNTGGSTAVIRINGTSVGGDGQNANPLKQLNTVDVSAQGGVQTISLQGTADGYAAKMGALICNPGAGEIDAVNGAKEVIPVGNAAATNFNPFTTDINAVRGQESGYATLNPLAPSGIALSEGNLSLSFTNSVSESISVPVTMGATSGKFYVEFEYAASGGGGACGVGVVDLDSAGPFEGFSSGWNRIIYFQSGGVRKDNLVVATGLPTTRTAGDIMGISVDCDNGQVRFYVNGTLQHTETGLSYGRYGFHFGPNIGGSANTCTVVFNAGQKPFKYAPPEGFKTLCLANLPRPTKAAVRPDKYFKVITTATDPRPNPPQVGDFIEGGYYAGRILHTDNKVYDIIVSPKASGQSVKQWKTSNDSSSSSTSRTYGKIAQDANNNANHPAFQWAAGLNINGYTDWYIPAQDELNVCYRAFKPTTGTNYTTNDTAHGSNQSALPFGRAFADDGGPSQTGISSFQSGGSEHFTVDGTNPAGQSASYATHWSATEPSNLTSSAIRTEFGSGLSTPAGDVAGGKTNSFLVRAIRRRYAYDGDVLNMLRNDIPDGLYWMKRRLYNNVRVDPAESWKVVDSVRGFTNNLACDSTAAENTYSASLSESAAYAWKAGGAAVSNTDGSITSQVSVNRDAGFSIVRWSNQGTVGHGLGVAPSFIIVKSIDQTSGWWVYATALGNSNYGLPLHSTAAQNTGINWGGAPTSTVFYISSGNGALPATSDNIAYCFAEVENYSRFGKYTGNGSTDGVFVYLGFRPALLLTKRTDTTGNWIIQDSARGEYNPDLGWLYPDLSAAEETGSSRYCDFLSNGFKIRNGGTGMNASGGTYIYAAFAEAPTQNLFGGQANAR